MIEIGEFFGGADETFTSDTVKNAKTHTPQLLRPMRGILIASVVGICIWIGLGFLIWHMWF